MLVTKTAVVTYDLKLTEAELQQLRSLLLSAVQPKGSLLLKFRDELLDATS